MKQYKYTLPIGYKLQGGENVYVIEEVLGKGGFGVTYKVKARVKYGKIMLDAYFALKEYFPEKCWRGDDNVTLKVPPTMHDGVTDGIRDFINEGRKLQQVCDLNPHIVNVNEVFEANGTAYYVLEFLEGGDLRKMVKNNGGALSEQQMLDVMVPIGRAVQCLHDNNILHLDIKPDNIVMRRNGDGDVEPVLIDFGIAVHFTAAGTPTSKAPSQGLSPGYSPLEQYMLVKAFDPRIDVYSFCATCLYLLTGRDPREASLDLPADYVTTELPATVSPNVTRAIEHGMSMNKNTRTGSIREVLAEFGVSEENLVAVPTKKSQSPSKHDGTINLHSRNDALRPVLQPADEPEEKTVKNKKLMVALAIVLAMALIAGIVLLSKGCGTSTKASQPAATATSAATDDAAATPPPSQATVDELNKAVTEEHANPDANYSYDAATNTVTMVKEIELKAGQKEEDFDVATDVQKFVDEFKKSNKTSDATIKSKGATISVKYVNKATGEEFMEFDITPEDLK